MLQLSSIERRELRARAHNLNPVVSIAENGLTAAVLKEIDINLTAHELIKVRVYGDSRENRLAYLEQICSELGAAVPSMKTSTWALVVKAERRIAKPWFPKADPT